MWVALFNSVITAKLQTLCRQVNTVCFNKTLFTKQQTNSDVFLSDSDITLLTETRFFNVPSLSTECLRCLDEALTPQTDVGLFGNIKSSSLNTYHAHSWSPTTLSNPSVYTKYMTPDKAYHSSPSQRASWISLDNSHCPSLFKTGTWATFMVLFNFFCIYVIFLSVIYSIWEQRLYFSLMSPVRTKSKVIRVWRCN